VEFRRALIRQQRRRDLSGGAACRPRRTFPDPACHEHSDAGLPGGPLSRSSSVSACGNNPPPLPIWTWAGRARAPPGCEGPVGCYWRSACYGPAPTFHSRRRRFGAAGNHPSPRGQREDSPASLP